MMIFGIFSILLGITNYIGPEILHHSTATEEGAKMRGGIVRIYFPAYWLIVYASLYSFTLFITSDRIKRFPLLFFIISIMAIIFRQTRVIIGTYGIIACFNIIRRMSSPQAKFLIFSGFFVFTGVLMNLDKFEFLKSNVEKTKIELTESSGSWGGRVDQLKTTWEIFQEGPLFGVGSSALRSNVEAYASMPHYKVKRIMRYSIQSDLGYPIWLKNFGLIGALYLFLLALILYKDLRLLKRNGQNPEITTFIGNYIFFILISFFTVNYLGQGEGIILFSSILAMIQSSTNNARKEGLHDHPSKPS